MRYLIVMMLIFVSTSTGATKIARVSLDELAQDAKYIAMVKVLSAQLDESDAKCGIVYKVKILEDIKNAEKNSTINIFSAHNSIAKLKTGEEFIVFLDENKSGVCSQTDISVGHAGYGALWVTSPYLIDFNVAVRIPKSFIALPSNLKTQPGQRPDDEISEIEWADQVKFIEHLKKFH